MNPSPEELLFAAASGFNDSRERCAFLDFACPNDPEMRKRLDEMLAIEAEAAAFFELQPAMQFDGGMAEQAKGEEGLGTYIGRYRLVTRIGAGGCGVVYLAEQEKPVRRKVALKIIKLGMDTEAVIARFEQERQALALMDHPSIAHVLDAAATASGRPYFVMELVEGDKITDFCDANRFTVRQRLELFVDVCRAIQHAHQKGLIHRDIKPSNILVRLQEGKPMPTVIDFGIAKATSPSVGSDAVFTQFDQFLGTPTYMSPEQAQGCADIDTRSDIYSLGVLLYETISGQTPFDLQGFADGAVEEVRRIIREKDSKPPSAAFKAVAPDKSATIAANRRTDAKHLAAQLTGDIDWIVMKAMEKERSRRYETANGLAIDIQRYLHDEVVSAHPPSRAYRLGKLVRRHKPLFAAASVAIFGLLLGFGVSAVMFFRERAARQEQARLREKAEYREFVYVAAVKVKDGDLKGADELLAKVPLEETPSSLEAAQTFSTVAQWHMQEGRMVEATARFTAVAKAISSADLSDLKAVSIEVVPAITAAAYVGGPESFEMIRRLAIKRFGTTANPMVAEQILKTCLLLPADKKILESLAPMDGVAERAVTSGEGISDRKAFSSAWASFSIALWRYRNGENDLALTWVSRSLRYSAKSEARTANMLIVRAMIEQQAGQPEKARASLAQGRAIVEQGFASKKWMAESTAEHWFDWCNATILLKEAERVIGAGQGS